MRVLLSRRSAVTTRTPQCRKAREVRAKKARKKELEDLKAELHVKRDNIIRQAVHAQPELVERAAERIQTHLVRRRLLEHDSVMAAYQTRWDGKGRD